MAVSLVQAASNGVNATSIAVGSGQGWATPTAGNLLVVVANSDALVTLNTAGFTLGPSVIDGNGTYLWYKVAAGTESSVQATPSVSDKITLSCLEYAGTTAAPFDASNSSTVGGSIGGTILGSVTSTNTAGGVVVFAACVHSLGDTPLPICTYSNSFVQRTTANAVDGVASGTNCVTYVADLVIGVNGAYSTTGTMDIGAFDRQGLIAAFKASTAAGGGVVVGWGMPI